jgi:hypothetical protein
MIRAFCVTHRAICRGGSTNYAKVPQTISLYASFRQLRRLCTSQRPLSPRIEKCLSSTTGDANMFHDQNCTWVDQLSPRLATLIPFLKLVRIDRPIGTWLALLPGFWGLALAADPGTIPSPWLLSIFGLGAFIMRGAGCTINDMWDRNFDSQVARTSQRPLAKGTVSLPAAWAFLSVQLSAGFALLATLPAITIGLGVALVPIVMLYPSLKRVTYWPQVVLGAAMNWGVLMGWAVVHGLDGMLLDGPVALYSGGVLWTLVGFFLYSHNMHAFLFSIPYRFYRFMILSMLIKIRSMILV